MKKKLPNWTIGEAIIAEYFGCEITKSIGPMDYYPEEQFWKFRLGFAVVMASYRNDVGLLLCFAIWLRFSHWLIFCLLLMILNSKVSLPSLFYEAVYYVNF